MTGPIASSGQKHPLRIVTEYEDGACADQRTCARKSSWPGPVDESHPANMTIIIAVTARTICGFILRSFLIGEG
jgi:hypothetical protein